jgi:hypothetical protein
MTAKAKTKTKTKTDKKPKQENLGKDKQTPLDRELADSFPASDPPSVTQPSIKSGAPERKPSSRTSKPHCCRERGLLVLTGLKGLSPIKVAG